MQKVRRNAKRQKQSLRLSSNYWESTSTPLPKFYGKK